MDNPFNTPSEGQGDWDSGLGVNWASLERGYHVTERAGIAINTGAIVWINSGGFAFPFDPNSRNIYPHAMAFTASASGDTATFLAWGIVRSLNINSPSVPGFPLYVSALTPGLIVSTPTGHKIGRGLTGYGVLFNPPAAFVCLAEMFDVNTNGVSNGKVLAWSDATSKWVPAAAAAGGSTTLAGLTDVDTTGVASGKVLAWSNVSSKWVPTTSGGGGSTSVGSPPVVVQAMFALSRNDITFTTTPSSGNIIVMMGWNPTDPTLAAIGWTTDANNASGTDYGVLASRALSAPGPKVNTFFASSLAAMAVWAIELVGGKGATPTFFTSALQAEQNAIGLVGASGIVSNLVDMISIQGLCLISGAASLTAQFNVTSVIFANSGTNRQVAGGWSWADRANAQIFTTWTSSSANGYKGLVGLYKS